MEISGSVSAAQAALETVSRGGRIVYFANCRSQCHLLVDVFRLVNDEISISGIFQFSYVFPRAMRILSKLDLRKQTEKIFAIDQTEQVWEAHMSKKYPQIVLKIT